MTAPEEHAGGRPADATQDAPQDAPQDRAGHRPAGADPFAPPPAAPRGWTPPPAWGAPSGTVAGHGAATSDAVGAGPVASGPVASGPAPTGAPGPAGRRPADPYAAPRPADPYAAPRPFPAGAPQPPAPSGWGSPSPWGAPTAPGRPAGPAASPYPAPGAPAGTLPPTPLPTDPAAAPAPALLPPGVLPPPMPDLGVPARSRRRGRSRRLPLGVVAGLVVAAFGAGLLGGVVGARFDRDDAHLADAGLPAAVGSGAGDRAPDSVAGIAAAVLPSVVSIEVSSASGGSTGSGLVLRQDGYILTNHHVVASAAGAGSSIVVLLADGSQLPGTIVGSTSDYDLAVVKVEAEGLTPLVLGDSDEVQVGDPVVAIGAPLGLAGTVTTGIVSALNRPVAAGEGAEDTAFINAIQTDAAINPGNSGGPLVNAAGEVVGINSAIAQPPGASATSGGSIGLGFAIPSNQARRTAEQLIETGVATYPVIGVLLDGSYTGEGVQVSAEPQGGQQPVTPGGPAERAGIRAGDVILAIDGRPVTASDELVVAIRARTPGDAVTLRVRAADGAERDVRVVLDESAQG
ncbi:trypsin-like peptidase domain-containing protein [Cellulosimicrobium cellulans]|uniref:trypsin-like peptidase domain-containing protein n=1 Tax=Cellulosimicrobium cellulans TaxID=1710 RepID=UPI0021CB929C|nr:trypsin-like peptidase domain-containing protein [Cellulosimicrobium cellulans]